ncbi:MAG TPA: DUF255 domain-containing protein [Candidatus Bathyarchaeia archaeon]|nr:DUF255 domain-containing protein [Candidatus Bathyarchaeia archaeon]
MPDCRIVEQSSVSFRTDTLIVHISFLIHTTEGLQKIEWADWQKESFEKARSTRKPILLDIKGSWCHWCHVMDDTSYSDPVVIDLVNKGFIPIRVDTDKRPDVNRRYNMGGWPSTVFLDDKGEIITGGTYIPPEQFRQVLRSVLDFYSRNKESVKSKLQRPIIPRGNDQPLTERIGRDISTTIAVNFDIDYGGFGFEPKFPHSDALQYALVRYEFHNEHEMLKVATKTLEMMAKGGIYDEVEHGFFRYSTTRDWSIPHFEKMAEDNARLLGVYLNAYKITQNPLLKETAEEIIEYVTALLSNQQSGGFYGSQDADENYYSLSLPDRRKQTQPKVDTTIYVNYNALFVSSYLLAAVVLDRPDLGTFALKTLDYLLKQSLDKGQLVHFLAEGNSDGPRNLLIDSATVLLAVLDAYEYTGERNYLDRAVQLAESSVDTLYDSDAGGFYDAPADPESLGQLRARDKPLDENSQMSLGFLRLSWLSGNQKYYEMAEKSLRIFNQDYERYGLMAASYGLALDSLVHGPIGIAIVSSPSEKIASRFRNEALKLSVARRYILQLDPFKDVQRMEALGYGKSVAPVAHVCVGKVCGPPLTDPSALSSSVHALTVQNG